MPGVGAQYAIRAEKIAPDSTKTGNNHKTLESMNFDKISLLNKMHSMIPSDLRPEIIDGSICFGRPRREASTLLSASMRVDGFRIDCIQHETAGKITKYSIILTNPDGKTIWREDLDDKGPHLHSYLNGVKQSGHPKSSGSIEEIVSNIVTAIRG